MVRQGSWHNDDAFTHRPRNCDIGPFELQEELFFPLDYVNVADPKRYDNCMPLASLKAFDSVNALMENIVWN